MISQPWLQARGWPDRDPKLREARSQPLFMPHTRQLAESISLRPPGILLVRGPRQTGKSTLLRQFAERCLREGIAPEELALVDAERCADRHHLLGELEGFLDGSRRHSVLLVDELTSIPEWWLALKILADAGKTEKALVIGTGSSAEDLAQGADALPGRRGRRHPVDWELLPVPYAQVRGRLKLEDYFLTGGFPWAINEYLRLGFIPAHVYELHAAAIQGAFQRRRHLARHLPHLLNYLAGHQGSPTSVQKLSRDCGLGSNRTGEEHLALLEQVYALLAAYWAEPSGGPPAPRKNRKFYAADPFLFHMFHESGKGWEGAFAAARSRLSSPEFEGRLAEGLVAAELRRRSRSPRLGYWSGAREIDFLGSPLVEVKYQARASVEEFAWAEKVLPRGSELLVLTRRDSAVKGRVRLMPLEKWLGEG